LLMSRLHLLLPPLPVQLLSYCWEGFFALVLAWWKSFWHPFLGWIWSDLTWSWQGYRFHETFSNRSHFILSCVPNHTRHHHHRRLTSSSSSLHLVVNADSVLLMRGIIIVSMPQTDLLQDHTEEVPGRVDGGPVDSPPRTLQYHDHPPRRLRPGDFGRCCTHVP